MTRNESSVEQAAGGCCRAIDHVVLRLREPEMLLSLFGDVFGWATTWPRQRAAFADFAWVHVGNTHLELWAATDNSDLPDGCTLPIVHGFAIEPRDLEQDIKHLAQAGIACKAPRRFATPGVCGQPVTQFTNAVILDVSAPTCCIFFCEWGLQGTIFPWEPGLSTQDRRMRDRADFDKSGGGALGLVGLSKISFHYRNPDEARKKWRAITGADNPAPAAIDGVALDISEGLQDAVAGLTFAVRSPEKARRFLSERGLLDASSDDGIRLRPCATGGLAINFVSA